jgi:hypothetical protein
MAWPNLNQPESGTDYAEIRLCQGQICRHSDSLRDWSLLPGNLESSSASSTPGRSQIICKVTPWGLLLAFISMQDNYDLWAIPNQPVKLNKIALF